MVARLLNKPPLLPFSAHGRTDIDAGRLFFVVDKHRFKSHLVLKVIGHLAVGVSKNHA